MLHTVNASCDLPLSSLGRAVDLITQRAGARPVDVVVLLRALTNARGALRARPQNPERA